MTAPSGEVVSWKKEEETVFIGRDREQLDTDTDLDSPNIPSTKFHRHDASKSSRTPIFVYVISFFSIIGGFLFGYDTGVIAGALLELEKDFRLDATKKELVVSVTIVAAALGALCGGPFNEKLGRKPTIMIASMTFAVGALLMGVAPTGGGTESWSWLMVLAGRFIVGLGIGERFKHSIIVLRKLVLKLRNMHTSICDSSIIYFVALHQKIVVVLCPTV